MSKNTSVSSLSAFSTMTNFIQHHWNDSMIEEGLWKITNVLGLSLICSFIKVGMWCRTSFCLFCGVASWASRNFVPGGSVDLQKHQWKRNVVCHGWEELVDISTFSSTTIRNAIILEELHCWIHFTHCIPFSPPILLAHDSTQWPSKYRLPWTSTMMIQFVQTKKEFYMTSTL